MGQQPPNRIEGPPVVVLDTTGFWRMHSTLRPPLIQSADGPNALLFGEAWLDGQTAPPPEGWVRPDFDDGEWVRAVTLRACKTPYLSRLCLRGRFEVTDPGKVRGLALTVVYHGGAVVYVNGKEVARAHLPKGLIRRDTLAEAYSVEASVAEDGELFWRRTKRSAENTRRVALRDRRVGGVPVPAGLLRKGVNVVAIEIIRSPYNQIHQTKKRPDRQGKLKHCLQWNTCEIRWVQLTAAGAEGLVPNATRPEGLQVWNSDLMMSDFDMDFGDAAEPLRPVKIVGARNGAFSGKFVAGSTKPIRGLKATPGPLTCGQATIPASAVRVRYAVPWDSEHLVIPYSGQVPPYPRNPSLLGALVESPPKEVSVRTKPPVRRRADFSIPHHPEPVSGAVVPVWLTVSIPSGAWPGTYAGNVRLEVQGAPAVSVPVELTVVDWSLPDTQDYQTWVELIQSPDTLAMEYGLELWSAKHWKMIEQAMRYAGQTGSRVVHVPLIAQTNLGHEQSMVRWVRKGDGTYDYDLSILDRYLDAAAKHMGRPKMVVLWVWEIYLIEKEKYQGRDHLILEQAIAARQAMRGTGPMVTTLDRATGKTETVSLPPYKDPNSKALWAPLMKKVREHIHDRGMAETVMLGMMNDTLPSKQDLEFWADLCPGVPWALQAHGGPRFRTKVHGVASLGYKAIVWTVHFSADKSLYGWKGPNLLAYYDRERRLNSHTPALWAHLAEMSVTGDQRGTGRLGADYWPVLKDKKGQRMGYVWGRYPHSSWRNLDLWSYVLAPGPDGPVASTCFEYFREGVQHCEARIFIERALLDRSLRAELGENLAQRCQQALDTRQQAMVKSMAHLQMSDPINGGITRWRSGTEVAGHIWYLGSGWQQRSQELYSLAGQVSAKLKGK